MEIELKEKGLDAHYDYENGKFLVELSGSSVLPDIFPQNLPSQITEKKLPIELRMGSGYTVDRFNKKSSWISQGYMPVTGWINGAGTIGYTENVSMSTSYSVSLSASEKGLIWDAVSFSAGVNISNTILHSSSATYTKTIPAGYKGRIVCKPKFYNVSGDIER